MRPLKRASPAAFLLVALALPAAAQPATPSFLAEPEARGTAYYVYAEPGAPTIEVVMLGSGTRSGIYRIQEGTTLIETLALAGGTSRSDSTAAGITTALVRVHREVGNSYDVIYEATSEEFVRNRANHPDLRSGDTIEAVVNFEPAEEPGFTFEDGLNVASRVASLASLLYLILSGRR